MKLKLAPHGMTHALTTEMNEALKFMERGNYDAAFKILEDRCRPNDLLERPGADPCGHDLHRRRVVAAMLEVMPPGMLTERCSSHFYLVAAFVAQAFAPGEWVNSSENALCAAAMAAEYGISLEVDYEIAQEEQDAAIAELMAINPDELH